MISKNKTIANAGWLIGGKIVQSLIGIVVWMLTARYLGPENFGLLNYAASVTTFAAPIVYLGLNAVLVHELIKNPQDEGRVMGTSIVMSLASSVMCILGIVAFSVIASPGDKEATMVCLLYSISLVFQAVGLLQYWFQAKLLSKYAVIATLVAYVAVNAYKIFLLVTQKNLYWFAISSVIQFAITSILLLMVYRRKGGVRFTVSLKTARELFSVSRYYIVSGLMISLFSQTDKIMLRNMLDDTATGYYSAALTCAGIAGFVFAAIIDSARPGIFEKAKNGSKNFEDALIKLYSVIIYLSLLQCVAIVLFPRTMIRILCGSEYLEAVPVLLVVVWYTIFSYIGSVRNIWILATDKKQYLWIINLLGAVLNIVLNLLMIPSMGAVGAALASLLTQAFTNVGIGFILKPIRGNNRLLFKSLDPRVLIGLIKDVL